ncbi:MAG: hypothetical protein RML56_08740 [Burkholderiales bacterium]|nr:hypothetical protein [Burkholderiales bacterium]
MHLDLRLAAGLWALASVSLAVPAYWLLEADWVVPVAQPQAALLVAFLLAIGFRLTGEERERARIRDLFGRYVSDDVVEKLLADERRPDLAGEAVLRHRAFIPTSAVSRRSRKSSRRTRSSSC